MKKRIFCFVLLSAFLIGMVSVPSADADYPLKIGDVMSMKVGYRFQGVGQWTEDGAPSGSDYLQNIYLKRNRIWLKGKIGPVVSFLYQLDERASGLRDSGSSSGGLETRDAMASIHFANELNFSAGIFKIALSRQRNSSGFGQLTWDRPFVEGVATQSADRLGGKRDRQAMLWGNLFDNMFQYRLSVSDGVASMDGKDKNRYGGRFHITLWDPEKKLGYAGTYRGKKKVLTIGGGFDTQENIHSATADNAAWTIDAMVEHPLDAGVPTLEAGYFNLDTDNVSSKEGNGWYVQTAWLIHEALFGGDLQFFGKYASWNPDTKTSSYNRDEYALGFNLYLAGQNVKIVGEWLQKDYDSATGKKDVQVFTTMVQVQFK